jgi:hypothetical protein
MSAEIHTTLKVGSPTWRSFLHLLEMFRMLLDSFWSSLRDLALTKRVRIPRLETFLLQCCRVAYAFRAVCLEHHGFERASCSRHDDGDATAKSRICRKYKIYKCGEEKVGLAIRIGVWAITVSGSAVKLPSRDSSSSSRSRPVWRSEKNVKSVASEGMKKSRYDATEWL